MTDLDPSTLVADLAAALEKAKVVDRLVDDLQEELASTRFALAESHQFEEALEEANYNREADQEAMTEALKVAHERARHAGPWAFCQDPICSALEDWVHSRRKAG